MAVWVAVFIVTALGASLVLKRSSCRSIDAGQVSNSWLREHRAEKRERFPL